MDRDSYPPSGELINNGVAGAANLAERIIEPVEASLEEEGEESRGCSENAESETEFVSDEIAGDYQDEVTGIKVRYSLTPEEVKEFIRHSRAYEKCGKVKRKHTVIQSVLFTLLVSMACISGSFYYIIMASFPLLALGLMWAIPFINLKSTGNKLLREEQLMVEIFPDRLEMESKTGKKTLFLNDLCESIEHNNMIMVFTPDSGMAIPLRSVDPELRADIQAMIAAGSNPLHKKHEKDKN